MKKLEVEVSHDPKGHGIVLIPKNEEANNALLGLVGGDFCPEISPSSGLMCRECKKIIPTGSLNDYGRSIACKCKEPKIIVTISPCVF